MKTRFLPGVVFIILGLAEAIGPYTFIPVCESMDGNYMKCRQTASAELGVGLVIVVLGLLLILLASSQIRLGLSIAIGLNAVLVILIPNVLIGVCPNAHMKCHALTLPALSLLGILTLIGAAVNIWYLWKANRKEESV